MALVALQSHLEKTFFAAASQGMDACIRLVIADEELLLEIVDEQIQFRDFRAETSARDPDATFYFEDVDTAWALLSGQADAIGAFMEGKFRSDGYLMWAFTLMSMFRSESLPDTPTE